MQSANLHGVFLGTILIGGYPITVYLSSMKHENMGNQITTQLVQAYEERKNATDDRLDIPCALPYHG